MHKKQVNEVEGYVFLEFCCFFYDPKEIKSLLQHKSIAKFYTL